jgi:hypothetical protein
VFPSSGSEPARLVGMTSSRSSPPMWSVATGLWSRMKLALCRRTLSHAAAHLAEFETSHWRSTNMAHVLFSWQG